MAKIEFPKPLKNLLEDNALQPHIRDYANRAGEILADNKLPFFPDYTDHGVEHINQVLLSEVELVPKDVWTNSAKDSDPKLLNAEDAVVLIGATLLHDIAMHLRPDGFLELVGESYRFRPLPWFKDEQEDHAADRPWRELWLDYQREARRFSDRDLGNIIGLESVRQGWKFDKLPENSGQWERNHCLIIGEFIRRHHARLAHEIANYGFPGLDVGSNEGQFPALGEKGNHLQSWADLIGLAARSHGLSLRVCQAYLNQSSIYSDELKPGGSAVFYPMALLRVADYLQIDRQRTPTALLKLRNPQSPVSVQEWNKHLAVQRISTSKHNPYSKTVTVSPDISLAVYLQLRDLLAGLQTEMDHATAVLDEVYGRCTELGLHQLNLATRRIVSNLHSPAFRENLPYVPERTGFAADPNLLTLLVEPLYGKEPSVGVRELMQNAVDAVCELHAWCETRGIAVESLDLPEQDSDVQIDFIKRDDGTWLLRVTDKGIGMTADTIQNYFLRAGASFRQSKEWSKEFLDEQGKPRVMRAGRFGIGAFAVFLLGNSFRLWTRHVGAKNNEGYLISVETDSRGIEIRREKKSSIGTLIEVELSDDYIADLKIDMSDSNSHFDVAFAELNATIAELDLISRKYTGVITSSISKLDWYCLDWPIVSKRIIKGDTIELLNQEYTLPWLNRKTSPEWSVIQPSNFDEVCWTFNDYPSLVCNGLRISEPDDENAIFYWPDETQLNKPKIAVLDSQANLPLTLQRFRLSNVILPFLSELSRDVTLSFIAHSLICGPTSPIDAHFSGNKSKLHPLIKHQATGKDIFRNSLLRWCTSTSAVIPADCWLFSLLQSESCLIFGEVSFPADKHEGYYPKNAQSELYDCVQKHENRSILAWNGCIKNEEHLKIEPFLGWLGRVLIDLSIVGFRFIDGSLLETNILISWHRDIERIKGVIGEFNEFITDSKDWRNVTPTKGSRKFIHYSANSESPSARLTNEIEQYAKNLKGQKNIVYFVEIKTKSTNTEPKSQLAKIWNECLGPNPIPFDPIALYDLIEKGRQHPELKIHIEKWEEMKRTGSKWVVGNKKA